MRKIIKAKVLISIFVIIAMFAGLGANISSAFTDVPASASYIDSVNRLVTLKIMGGDATGLFRPTAGITREQFLKMTIKAIGKDADAEAKSGATRFTDVAADRWSSGYINYADSNVILSPGGELFLPDSEITFGEACEVLIRAGWNRDGIMVKFSGNFIGAALDDGLTKDISFSSTDKLPRWAAAVMIDKLWYRSMQAGAQFDFSSIDLSAIGNDVIILGNSATDAKLAKDQVLTDKGAYYVSDKAGTLALGQKYRVFVYDDTIVKVMGNLSTSQNITVYNVTDSQLQFKDKKGEITSMTLPLKISYYYNGQKQTYDSIKNVLEFGSSVVFVYGQDKTGFDYAVVFDPVYGNPVVAHNIDKNKKRVPGIIVPKGSLIIKDQDILAFSDIDENDVLYKVTDIWGKNPYILVVSNAVSGKLTAATPNKAAPKSLSIDGKSYSISEKANIKKIITAVKDLNLDEYASLILGRDGKIVEVQKSQFVSGSTAECKILGDATTQTDIPDNQILTDKGTYYLLNKDLSLKPGYKYKLVINGDTVVKVDKLLKAADYIVVNNIVGNKIRYTKNGTQKTMILPENAVYYYEGTAKTYTSVSGLIKLNTTLAFVPNDTGTGYEYAVICDPVYSKPAIVKSNNPELDSAKTIIKEGKIITQSDVADKDVLYNVSDILGGNTYILDVRSKASGKITDITPNKLAPNALTIDNTSYSLSDDFNFEKLTNATGSYKKDDHIVALLGYDGKIADIYDDSSNYAFIISYTVSASTDEEDFGKTVYTAKFLQSDGSKVSYKVNSNPEAMKGSLVSYTFLPDGTADITPVKYTYFGDSTIDKEEKLFNNDYVSSNVVIFNFISNPTGADSVASVIDWDDMPNGKVDSAKVKFVAKAGDFQDINVMLVSDILDSKYTLGYVGKAASTIYLAGGSLYGYNVYANGSSIIYKPTESLKIAEVYKVWLENGAVRKAYEVQTPVAVATTIQALDASRIKVNDKVYRFKDNCAIYYKYKNKDNAKVNDYDISHITTDNVDLTKTYTSVKVYLDKALEDGGKVGVIVIEQ